jgi:hypothetical protein
LCRKVSQYFISTSIGKDYLAGGVLHYFGVVSGKGKGGLVILGNKPSSIFCFTWLSYTFLSPTSPKTFPCSAYESPLDNNSVYAPCIQMRTVTGSIYNSFFDPPKRKYPGPASCTLLPTCLSSFIGKSWVVQLSI